MNICVNLTSIKRFFLSLGSYENLWNKNAFLGNTGKVLKLLRTNFFHVT